VGVDARFWEGPIVASPLAASAPAGPTDRSFSFAAFRVFRDSFMVHRVSFKKYRLPLPVPLRTAHGLWREREGIFVRLESESGGASYGEIAPLAWFGTETLREAVDVVRGLGEKADDAALDSIPERFGCVRFALSAARWAGPAATAGGKLPVAALLPAGRAALDRLPNLLEQGFLAFKWKVGVGRPDEEWGLLDELLSVLPAYTRLRLDANGAWDRQQAGHWLTRCAERPVEYVEQPLAPEDRDGLLGLSADFPVKLALDESVTGLAAAREWQALGWRGVFVIKPALAGPLPALAAWIGDSRADVVLSSAVETALGRAALLRYALAHNLTKRALGFGLGSIFGDRRWDGPVTGPLLDQGWCDGVNAGELWNALN
jgi:O-succinylbenzoate synthase